MIKCIYRKKLYKTMLEYRKVRSILTTRNCAWFVREGVYERMNQLKKEIAHLREKAR